MEKFVKMKKIYHIHDVGNNWGTNFLLILGVSMFCKIYELFNIFETVIK